MQRKMQVCQLGKKRGRRKKRKRGRKTKRRVGNIPVALTLIQFILVTFKEKKWQKSKKKKESNIHSHAFVMFVF